MPISFIVRTLFRIPGGDSLFNYLVRSYTFHQRQRIQRLDLPFFDQTINLLEMTASHGVTQLECLARGLMAAEVILPSDRVLDLGFGDGFFAARFCAPRCAQLDAIDQDSRAVSWARSHFSSSKVNFLQSDFLRNPFPQPNYDVVMWNAAYGLFDNLSIKTILQKIVLAVGQNGIFIGSVSIGEEKLKSSHLESSTAITKMLSRYFPIVYSKSIRYPIVGRSREELYWRCSMNRKRIEEQQWNQV